VNIYKPNAVAALDSLPFKLAFAALFESYLQVLTSLKSVVVKGDMNGAREEIDLALTNDYRNNPGFTPKERNGFGEMLRSEFFWIATVSSTSLNRNIPGEACNRNPGTAISAGESTTCWWIIRCRIGTRGVYGQRLLFGGVDPEALTPTSSGAIIDFRNICLLTSLSGIYVGTIAR